MENAMIVSMGIPILGVLVFGVFVVAKRLDDSIKLQKETNELLKTAAENSSGK
jgi:hypothetical protein